MERLGDQFLAGPAFALQKNRRAAGCDLGYEVENLEHGLALAHDVVEVVALFQSALELNVFFFRTLPGDRGANIGQKLFIVPGLLDEVSGAILHGAHGVLDRAVRGDHDYGLQRIQHVNLAQQVHTVSVRQSEIEQDDIEVTLTQQGHTLAAGSRGCHGVAFELQKRFQRLPNFGFVINDQYAAEVLGQRFWRHPARNNRSFRHGRPS